MHSPLPLSQVLEPWAKERGLAGDVGALCANHHVREAVMKSMQEEARVAQLRGFEQVRRGWEGRGHVT